MILEERFYRQVSVTLVTILKLSYNNNTSNTPVVTQKMSKETLKMPEKYSKFG